MAKAKISGLALAGISVALPTTARSIDEEAALFGSQAQIERIKKNIGLDRRRVVGPGQTALDLGQAAAGDLLAGLNLPVAALDAIIFVTQTPDHFQPGNAALLHGRLGADTHTAAFDVNLGCSGYVYGLWLAGSLMAAGGCQRVLVVAADTLSRVVHPRDRSVVVLFGDAGSATLVEVAPATGEPWSFVLNSEGAGHGGLMQPAGAFRQPLDADALREAVDADGNVRRACDLRMDGGAIFDFSLRRVPEALTEVLALAGWAKEDVDYFVLHQANRYVLTNVARRMRVPLERVPMNTVERYGNSSSASIPVTLVDALAGPLREARPRLALCGFGVGLSWAAATMAVDPLRLCRFVEVPPC